MKLILFFHSLIFLGLLINTPEQEQQILQELYSKFVKLQQIKKQNPDAYKQFAQKAGKDKLKQLKFYHNCIVQIKKIRNLQVKAGSNDKKVTKLDQKIDNIKKKADARGINISEDDQEDKIKLGAFLEKSKNGLDSISTNLKQLNTKLLYSVDLAALKSILIKEVKMQSPFGELLKSDLQDRLSELAAATVQDIQKKFSEMVKHYLDKNRRIEHYNINASSFYKEKSVQYTQVSEDLELLVTLIGQCSSAKVINDPKYIKTTKAYKDNLIKLEKVEKTLVDWKKELITAINHKYEKANPPISKDTTLKCSEIKTNLTTLFASETQLQIKQLYNSIVAKFDGQIEVIASEAKNYITHTISSYTKNRAYLQALIDAEEAVFDTKDPYNIAEILADAQVGGSGNNVKDSILQGHFDTWKANSLASLAPIKNDTQNFVDTYTLGVVGKDLKSKSDSAFADFWDRVNSVFTNNILEATAIDIKNDIKEEINNLKTSDFFGELKPTAIFPDITTLAAYINDVTMDTSWESYLAEWEIWRKANLVSAIGIPKNANFHAERLKWLMDDLLGFRYRCNVGIASFAAIAFSKLIDSRNQEKFSTQEMQAIWNEFIEDLSPSSSHFDSIKAQLTGKELYDYIQTYIKILPTTSDFQELIADAKESTGGGGDSGITCRGTIAGEFVWSDWAALNLLYTPRGFQLNVKVRLTKK
ncbi:MAG: hypothetical protein GY810_05010, partial [Aureispira sp.]|nr:hypothetical protein [Aureispira sp.]